MPEYDAFGREIGEDTLEGLGGPAQRAKPAEWSAEELAKAQAAARAEAQVQAAPPATAGDPLRAPETPRFEAPVADPEPAAPQRPVFVPQSTGPRVVRVRRAGLGCLGLFVGGPILLAILGIAAAVLFGLSSVDTKTDLIDVPRPSESPEIDARDAARPPTGLGSRSLVRRANFVPALKRLRSAGLGRLRSLTIRPERIDAELLTKGGRLRSAQVTFDGKLENHGASGPGFGHLPTVPFARVNTAAPERLTRQAARRVKRKPSSIDYVTFRAGLGGTAWGAYFKGGRIALGDTRGNFVRRIS